VSIRDSVLKLVDPGTVRPWCRKRMRKKAAEYTMCIIGQHNDEYFGGAGGARLPVAHDSHVINSNSSVAIVHPRGISRDINGRQCRRMIRTES